jgi:hypothetical protein
LRGAFVVIGDMGRAGPTAAGPRRPIASSTGPGAATPCYFFDPNADVTVACLASCCSPTARPFRAGPLWRLSHDAIDANFAYRRTNDRSETGMSGKSSISNSPRAPCRRRSAL